MSVGVALLLGVVQGLTEFVPVSSTAHLYIAQALLGIENDAIALSFDVVLHLGTAAALILALGGEIREIVEELFLLLSGHPVRNPAARVLILPLAVGTLPGVLAGLFLLKKFESVRTLGLIGASMLVASAYFLLAERRGGRSVRARRLAEVTLVDALWIGVAQGAAGLLAGFSRSGFTISTGRMRGFDRSDAARFSFLLALPIILGAGAKALLDLRKAPQTRRLRRRARRRIPRLHGRRLSRRPLPPALPEDAHPAPLRRLPRRARTPPPGRDVLSPPSAPRRALSRGRTGRGQVFRISFSPGRIPAACGRNWPVAQRYAAYAAAAASSS